MAQTARAPKGSGSLFQVTRRDGDKEWCAVLSWRDYNNLDRYGKAKRVFVRGFGPTPQIALQRRQERLLKRYADGITSKERTPRLSTYLDTWLDSYPSDKLSEESKRKYRRDIEIHVLPFVNRQLSEITSEELKALFYERMPGYASNSARWNVYKSLRTLLNHAVRAGVIKHSPLAIVPVPKPDTTVRIDDERLIGERIEASKSMLKSLSQPDHPLHDHYTRILLMFLGLRRSEILGLEWKCVVNLELKGKAYLVIRQQLKRHEDGSGWYIDRRTKNRKERQVPLPETWRLALLAEKAKCREANEQWASDLVFITPTGRHTDYNTHAAAWKMVMGGENESSYFRGHAARHVTASLMFDRGEPLEVVQAILGHSDRAMSLYYTHLTSRAKQAAVTNLEAGFFD